jgi:hypothetical protein
MSFRKSIFTRDPFSIGAKVMSDSQVEELFKVEPRPTPQVEPSIAEKAGLVLDARPGDIMRPMDHVVIIGSGVEYMSIRRKGRKNNVSQQTIRTKRRVKRAEVER